MGRGNESLMAKAKMAATSIYVKNTQNFSRTSPEPAGRFSRNLVHVCYIWDSSPSWFDGTRVTLTYFTQGQFWKHRLLHGEKVKTTDF